MTHCRRLCSGGRASEFQNVMLKSMLLRVANSFLPRCLARNLSCSSEFLVSTCHNSREYLKWDNCIYNWLLVVICVILCVSWTSGYLTSLYFARMLYLKLPCKMHLWGVGGDSWKWCCMNLTPSMCIISRDGYVDWPCFIIAVKTLRITCKRFVHLGLGIWRAQEMLRRTIKSAG